MMNYIAHNATSLYVPYVGFKGDSLAFLNEHFISQRVNEFLSSVISDNIIAEKLDSNLAVCDKDISTDYLYNVLLSSLEKKQEKIVFRIRYDITFDKDMAPHDSGVKCPIAHTNIQYGQISLGHKPIFYYIYINLQEMLQFLKKEYDTGR